MKTLPTASLASQCKPLRSFVPLRQYQRSTRRCRYLPCSTPRKLCLCVQSQNRTIKNAVRVKAGLFDFLGGGNAGKGKSAELVQNLLSSVGKTGLSTTSASSREEISELVNKLRQYRPRAPTKSPLFWGDFEVLFSTKSSATGGPVLGSAPGKLFFGSQKPKQSLQKPGTVIQSVDYKTFGLIPGNRSQEGALKIIDGNKYEVQLKVRGEDVTRRFEVLYLDEQIRVAQFLSDEEPEPVFFVFKRIAEASSLTQTDSSDDEPAPKEKPQKGTRVLKSRASAPPKEDDQLAVLTAALNELQEKSKATSTELREKEKSSSAAKRGAEPAKASLDKVQQEMQGLNQQLAEAVQAAEAAEGRYRQAVAGYREIEKAER